MNDRTLLTEELRAAREEKVRRERHEGSLGQGGVTAPRDPAYRRLRTLSAEELSRHIERLERDLEDLGQHPGSWAEDLKTDP